MNISIIIPSYNGAHKLPSLLKTLTEQSYTDFETLIVIDGSTDHTEEMLAQHEVGLKNLRVIGQDNKGRAGARNVGAKEAKGDLLIFFDDDLRLPPDTVAGHLKHHQHSKELSILNSDANLDHQYCKNEISKYRNYLETVRWRIGKSVQKQALFWENLALTTQNMSLFKNTFEQLGGFEERLRDSEDFELGVKALKAGVPIYYDPNLKVWHDDYISLEAYLKRQREYVNARKQLLQLRPEYALWCPKDFEQVKNPSRGIKKYFIYNAFWKQALQAPFLPQRLRYRLYDYVIDATAKADLCD